MDQERAILKELTTWTQSSNARKEDDLSVAPQRLNQQCERRGRLPSTWIIAITRSLLEWPKFSMKTATTLDSAPTRRQ
jgi:hypothetical protein